MNFITSKDSLHHAVNIVQKAVSNKTTMPILEGILFRIVDNTIYLMGLRPYYLDRLLAAVV